MAHGHGGQGPDLGGVNLVYCNDFDQIRGFPRLPSAHSVHRAKALRSWMELAIPHPTTKSFFAYDDVVDLQLKKTTAFLELQVDVRRGVEWQAMLLQPDAQQGRAARLPLQLRWTRVHHFGYPSTPLAHAPASPCSTLVMYHGCSPCAFKALVRELCSLGQQRTATRSGLARRSAC